MHTTNDKLTRDLRASIAAIERYSGPQLMTVPSDQLTAVLDEIEALQGKVEALDWQEITPQNLPKVGDEVWSSVLSTARAVDDSFKTSHGVDPRVWHQYGGWTHFRPINAPRLAKDGQA
jgi:hypothetical protein